MGGEYEEQAESFLEDIGAKMETEFLRHAPYFEGDKESRDIFSVAFTRDDGRRFHLTFGQSTRESTGGGDNPPTAYDVLAAIQKRDPGDFEEFASDFGYDTDSRAAHRTWKAATKEWEKVSGFFDEDELEDLQEIQ